MKRNQEENRKKQHTTKEQVKRTSKDNWIENRQTNSQNKQKPKTIPIKKKPRASCTRLRG